jgi:hypothetical protein
MISDSERFIENLRFCYHLSLRKQFCSGTLGPIWSKKYPQIFDEMDCALYASQSKRGYHFHEWLAAILLYETTGFFSLIEKYGSSNHERKMKIWESVAPQAIRDLPNDCGWPDLFVYAPDRSDFFFCETKGKDRLGADQIECFQAIHRACGKKVYLVQFDEIL